MPYTWDGAFLSFQNYDIIAVMMKQKKEMGDWMREKIAVIGGGAAGLMAGIFAAQENTEVTVLEGGARIGRKLLATGNGRCNLSNEAICPESYHGDVQTFSGVLNTFPCKQVVQIFERFGLLCRTGEQGRIYPYNVQASAVLDTLRRELEHRRVSVACDFAAVKIEKTGDIFRITSKQGATVQAHKVILAAGGKASPKLGSDGSGFTLARQLGHHVTPLVPALVGVKTDAHRAKPLKGMRSYAAASLWINGRKVREETGEVQFTEYGLSGICIFQFSRHINMALQENPNASMTVSLDLMPEYSEEWLTKKIAGHAKQYPETELLQLLSGLVNKRVGEAIVRLVFDKPYPMRASQCRFSDAQTLAAHIKHFSFPVTGSAPWDTAQVTAGGVVGGEVNPQTMESKCCSGLYLAGEILNLDGDCGGFNLHWAWVSGILAGRSAAGGQRPKIKSKQGGKPS